MANSAQDIGPDGILDETAGFVVETGKSATKSAAQKRLINHAKDRWASRAAAQLDSQAADGVGELSSSGPELTGTGALDSGAAGVGMAESENATLSAAESLLKFGVEVKKATPFAVGWAAGSKLSGSDLDGNDTIEHPMAYHPDAPDAKADLDGDGDIDRQDAYILDVMHHQGFEGEITKAKGIGQIDVTAMDVDGDGKVGYSNNTPTVTDKTVPNSAQDAKSKAAGHSYWSKSVTQNAVEAGPKTAGMEYLNYMRSKSQPNASADFDADGDIDTTDAIHEKNVHALGFQGDISHDASGRPILSALAMDEGDGSGSQSISISTDAAYAKYIDDVSKEGRAHGGWSR